MTPVAKNLNKLLDEIRQAIAKRGDILLKEINPEIIKLHSYFEYLVNLIFIICIYKDPKKLSEDVKIVDSLLGKISFKTKIDILRNNEILPESLFTELKKINTVRGITAHPIDQRNGEITDFKRLGEIGGDLVQIIVDNIDKSYIEEAVRLDQYDMLINNLKK